LVEGLLPPLQPLQPGQCVIVTDMDLLQVHNGPLWLDNLYVRLRRSDRDDAPVLVETDYQGQAYLTNVTLQGDGTSFQRSQGLALAARTLLHGTGLRGGGEGAAR
jgi:hypothetical protein